MMASRTEWRPFPSQNNPLRAGRRSKKCQRKLRTQRSAVLFLNFLMNNQDN